LEEGKYSFELKDEKDKVLQTVTNKADGTISFAGIEYDESQVGTHKYKISEVVGNEPGITYDKTVYKVEVSVTKDAQANRLNATVSKTPEELKFTNQYTPAEKTSVT
ncbi:FctA domain-containing protein, partial [Gemella haemolysans]